MGPGVGQVHEGPRRRRVAPRDELGGVGEVEVPCTCDGKVPGRDPSVGIRL